MVIAHLLLPLAHVVGILVAVVVVATPVSATRRVLLRLGLLLLLHPLVLGATILKPYFDLKKNKNLPFSEIDTSVSKEEEEEEKT